MARGLPETLLIGVDANGENLRPAARKAAREGATNVLFGRLSLEQAPGELAGITDRLTVLLPWGSLLRAVALADPVPLAALRGLCKPGAQVHLVFGYGGADAVELPPLEDGVALAARYRQAGFAVRARPLSAEGVRALATTWAGKLGWGRERPFVELTGRAE
jgi:hypothetical protein